MALALYRKYRPRTFAEVIGQEHVTEPLSQALRTGRLHHAYLFSGPRGCGKTSSARILARSLNCVQGPTPEPCGQCESCRSLATDGAGSIDVLEIDAASHGGVDDARELRERAFFAPVSSRYKIYVIDEAHMVSSAGFNALLKLVEEPPDYVKFIFATTEPEKVLGTIKSRTHHYPFRLIPPGVLRPYLEQLCQEEGVEVEPAVFPLVVRSGGGSARDTLSVLDQLIAGAGPEGVTYARAVALLGVTDGALIDEMCDAVAAGDGGTAFATIDRVAEAGHDPRRFAADLLERLRDLIVLQQVPDAVAKGLLDAPDDQLARMHAQASQLGPATLSRCADIVHSGLVEMRGATAPRLLLELICARMLLPGVDDSTGGLLQRLERMEARLAGAGGAPLPVGTGVGAAPTGDQPIPPAPAPPAAGGGGAGSGPARPGPSSRAVAGGGPAADVPVGPDGAHGGGAPHGGGPVGAAPPGGGPAGGVPPGATSAGPAGGPGGGGTVTASGSPVAVAGPGGGDVVAVRQRWEEILTVVGHRSKRAAAVVREATVRDVDAGVLILTFRHSVHATMLSGSPGVLLDAVYEVLGHRWQVRCELAGDQSGGPGLGPGAAGPPVSGQPAPTGGVDPGGTARGSSGAAARPQPAGPASQGAGPAPRPSAAGAASPAGGQGGAAAARGGGGPQAAGRQMGPGAPAGGADSGAKGGGPAAGGPAAGRGAAASRSNAGDAGTDWPEPARPGGSAARAVTRPVAAGGAPGAVAGDGGSAWPPAARPGGGQPAATAVASVPAGAAQASGPAVTVPTGTGLSAARQAAREAAVGRGAAGRMPAQGRAGAGAGAAQAGAAPTGVGARGTGADGQAWSDEPPYDPEYDGPVPGAASSIYEGFDPGDEPLDDVIDEKAVRQTTEQHALKLLQEALGAEQIGEPGAG